MKALSIGRDKECDIILNDSTDVISRRHAILNIYDSGKMTIIDQGHNGTYVNGIRITPNIPFPITRHDVVSFAHIMQLDWSRIPNQRGRLLYAISGIAALLVIVVAAIFFIPWGCRFNDGPVSAIVSDSISKANVAKIDSAKNDSLKKDSLKKDSVAKPEAAKHRQRKKVSIASSKRNVSKKPVDKKSDPKKDSSKQRII